MLMYDNCPSCTKNNHKECSSETFDQYICTCPVCNGLENLKALVASNPYYENMSQEATIKTLQYLNQFVTEMSEEQFQAYRDMLMKINVIRVN